MPYERLIVRLKPSIDAVSSLLDRLEAHAAATALPPNAAHRLAVVCEELVANVAMHGTPCATYVEISIDREADRLLLSIEDDGPPFDPLSVATPDTAASLDDRRVGGLGIHFVRKMVENLAYERLGAVNRLTAVLDTAQ